MPGKQVQKQESQQLTKPFLKTNLLSVLEKGDKAALNKHLLSFKERGVVVYDKVLAISSNERIPSLIKTDEGWDAVQIALTAALKSAFSNFNLRVGLNEDQMIDLAEAIIDQSHEDNLALEDVLLFLQRLVMGQAGKIYDRMDIPTFFELFEGYRQERHQKLVQFRDEQNTQFKVMGAGKTGNVELGGMDAGTTLSMMESLNMKDDE